MSSSSINSLFEGELAEGELRPDRNRICTSVDLDNVDFDEEKVPNG